MQVLIIAPSITKEPIIEVQEWNSNNLEAVLKTGSLFGKVWRRIEFTEALSFVDYLEMSCFVDNYDMINSNKLLSDFCKEEISSVYARELPTTDKPQFDKFILIKE